MKHTLPSLTAHIRHPLEHEWKSNPIYINLPIQTDAKSQQHLNKFYMYGITTLPQIENHETLTIVTIDEFHTKYKYA